MKKKSSLCRAILLTMPLVFGNIVGWVGGTNIGLAIADWQEVNKIEQTYGNEEAKEWVENQLEDRKDLPTFLKIGTYCSNLMLELYKK